MKKDIKNIFLFEILFKDLKISIQDIFNLFNTGNVEVNPYINQQITEAIHSIKNINDIKCGYKIFNTNSFSMKDSIITIKNCHFKTGKIITDGLNGMDEIAVFAVNAGKTINEIIEKHKTSDPFTAYIYDSIGSLIAESAAEFTHNKINEYAQTKKMSVSNRFSPGYCSWNVKEQHILFSQLPDKFCGITLTNSALMLPIKSVSGIIGIGTKIIKKEYGCKICTLQNCNKRRLK